MSGDLHEISRAIGALERSADEANRQRDVIFKKLDAISAQLQPIDQLARDVAEMKPQVDHYRRAKWWLMGLVAGLGLTGGALGERARHWLGWAVLLGAMLNAAPAAAQMVPAVCGKRAEILKGLTERYREAPVAVGLSNGGALVELLTNDTGSTWSIMVSGPNGVSCLVAAGEAWQQLKPTPPAGAPM